MAVFIAGSKNRNERSNPVGAPLLRKVFTYHGHNKASLKIVASGLYRLFLNGQELTRGVLAPSITNPSELLAEDTYDLSGLLRQKNVLAILLGNGFANPLDGNVWSFEKASWRSAPCVRIALLEKGEEILGSDLSFENHPSSILFDDLRAGEWKDGRIENPSLWTSLLPHPEAPRALPAPLLPQGIIVENQASPIKEYQSVEPRSIRRSGKGFLFDFGLNSAGYCRLSLATAKPGQRIDLVYGESAFHGHFSLANIAFGANTPKGFLQHDVYFAKGGKETYTPSFTYHGFRYVYVEGLSKQQAVRSTLTMILLRGAFPERGEFHCSDPIVERLENCIRNSDASNFLYFPTDCPQREKNGWTGDASLSASQFLFHYGCGASLRQWLTAMRLEQNPDGSLPAVVPTDHFGKEGTYGPLYDGALLEIPYQCWRYDGDLSPFIDNAEAIKKYFVFAESKRSQEGLFPFGIGDWCEDPCLDSFSTTPEVCSSLCYLHLAQMAALLFGAIGDEKEKESVLSFGEATREAFRKKYLLQGHLTCHSQTALAYALSVGLFNEGQEIEDARKDLLQEIHSAGDHIHVGVQGDSVLYQQTAFAGDAALAYRLLAQKSYPSLGYLVAKGITSLWEVIPMVESYRQDYIRQDRLSILSMNHHFWGSVSDFLVARLAGLSLVDGKSVFLAPSLEKTLPSAEASFQNRYGTIHVKAKRIAKGLVYEISNQGFHGQVLLGGKTWILKEGESRYHIPFSSQKRRGICR